MIAMEAKISGRCGSPPPAPSAGIVSRPGCGTNNPSISGPVSHPVSQSRIKRDGNGTVAQPVGVPSRSISAADLPRADYVDLDAPNVEQAAYLDAAIAVWKAEGLTPDQVLRALRYHSRLAYAETWEAVRRVAFARAWAAGWL
jgi:hypothetical protein